SAVISWLSTRKHKGPVLPRFSLIAATVAAPAILCPGDSGAWHLRLLPPHIPLGRATGGTTPPSAACPAVPRSLIGTSSPEKCSQCPKGNKGAAWSPSWPSRVARRAARSPSAVSVAVAVRPAQSWRFVSLIAVIFHSLVRKVHPQPANCYVTAAQIPGARLLGRRSGAIGVEAPRSRRR